MKYPKVKENLSEIEHHIKPSVDVLISTTFFKEITIGRYIHGGTFWQINQITGNLTDNDIIEWWYLPEKGTGNRPGELK
jgi:hypothetical protein